MIKKFSTEVRGATISAIRKHYGDRGHKINADVLSIELSSDQITGLWEVVVTSPELDGCLRFHLKDKDLTISGYNPGAWPSFKT